MTERFNRTLFGMLGTLEPEKKSSWHKYVAPLVLAYNSTRHESTGITPYFLMFGRHPRLPMDVAFRINRNPESASYSAYVENLKKRLHESYNIATKAAATSQLRQKDRYNLRMQGAALQPGDRVLVRKLAFEGKRKIEDKWQEDTYIVESQPNAAFPVYAVHKETDTSIKHTFYRSHLLPIRHTAGIRDEQSCQTQLKESLTSALPVPEPRNRKQKAEEPQINEEQRNEGQLHTNSSEEVEETVQLEVEVQTRSSEREVSAVELTAREELSCLEDAAPQCPGDDSVTTDGAGDDDLGDDHHPTRPDVVGDRLEDPEPEQSEEQNHPDPREQPETSALLSSGRKRQPPSWQVGDKFVMAQHMLSPGVEEIHARIRFLANFIQLGAVRKDP